MSTAPSSNPQALKTPVTILGLSKSGAAVARYGQGHDYDCFLSEVMPATEGNESLRQELTALGVKIEMGGHSDACFQHAQTVVLSPGIPPTNPTLKQMALSGFQLMSEVEFAYHVSQDQFSTPIPWVAITGTNGKTTVTTLISEILSQSHFVAPACGNIGLPIIEVLDKALQANARPDYLVAELSSFQIHFTQTLRPRIAVWTNFTPDHIDWHGSVDAYFKDKAKLFTGAQAPEWSVLWADDPALAPFIPNIPGHVMVFSTDPQNVAQAPNATTIDSQGNIVVRWKNPSHPNTPSQQTLFPIEDIQLLGHHNQLNVLAACAVATLLGVSPEVIAKACLAFKGVEHRLEPVGQLDGITFYNDSKATNPDAAISALNAFSNPKVVLICGGKDKLTPLDELISAANGHANHVVLLGQAKARFQEAFNAAGFPSIHTVDTLEDAIQQAFLLAKPQGSPVLFSPACASFDMFKSFEERGTVFKRLVSDFIAHPMTPSRG